MAENVNKTDSPKPAPTVSQAEYNKVVNAYKAVKTKLAEVEKANENALADKDKLAKITAERDKLKADIEKLAKDYETKLNGIRLESALNKTGVKNVRALKGLLDQSALTYDGDKIAGLDEQITAIKKSDPYLFENAPSRDTGFSSDPNPSIDSLEALQHIFNSKINNNRSK